jgi:hypothetical protein
LVAKKVEKMDHLKVAKTDTTLADMKVVLMVCLMVASMVV